MKIFLFIFLLTFFSSCIKNENSPLNDNLNPRFRVSTDRQEGALEKSKLLEELNRDFSFLGKPVHPKLIRNFEPWLSDKYPVIISLDIAAAYGTNEYSEAVYEENGFITYDINDEEKYGYKLISSENNIHILKTLYITGGTGSFISNLTFKTRIVSGFTDQGKSYDLVLLKLINFE